MYMQYICIQYIYIYKYNININRGAIALFIN